MGRAKPEKGTSKRPQFGLRWLLVVLLLSSCVLAWLSREKHRVARQTQLIAELAQIGTRVRELEPTGVDLVAHKVFGKDKESLSQWISEGWFMRPRVLAAWTTTDAYLDDVVEKIKQLGGIRELHVENPAITEQGIATLKEQLPEVAVLTRADLQGRSRPSEHFAAAALQAAFIAAATGLGVVIVLVWPILHWITKLRWRACGGRGNLPQE